MTRQNISTGTAANDGTGDTLRSAGTKINANFTELYTFLGGNANTLSTQLSIGSDGIIFEGSTADAHETTLKVTNPTQDNIITFPDSTGDVILTSAVQTLTNKAVSFQTSTISGSGTTATADATATLIICNKTGGSGLGVTLANGSHPGQLKIFVNKANNIATITPATFANGSSFQITQNEGATCIWDGSSWFLIGNQSITTIA